jgi:acetyl esterase/lipase
MLATTHLRRLLTLLACTLAFPAMAQLLSFQQILDRSQRPQPDHRVAYGADPNQVGELWLPTKGTAPYRVVLMIHGGCWLGSLPGPELLAFQADALRSAGVAVWSISYRRIGQPGGAYPGTFQDVAQGADHLKTLAASYPLDLANVVATGHSAGGHLALWAAGRPNIADGSPLKAAAPLPLKAVVAVAGIPDLAFALQASTCGDAVDKLVPKPSTAEPADAKANAKARWADTSPVELLPLRVPQTLVHGVYDGIVPPVHGYRLRQRATPLGDRVSIVNFDEAGHFELIAPWTPTGQRVVQQILQAFDAPR